jgi:hypothetical protein
MPDIYVAEDALGSGAVGSEDSQTGLIAVVSHGDETLAVRQPGHQAITLGVRLAILDDRALPRAERDRLATNSQREAVALWV